MDSVTKPVQGFYFVRMGLRLP